jgi:oligoendopeptidase F
MRIPQKDIDLFFKLHPALLQYVNQRLKIFPKIKTPEKLRLSGLENVNRVRTELWQRADFIDEFISDNPFQFSEEECSIIASWKRAVREKFYIFRHLKNGCIFLNENDPPKAYRVLSLNSELSEMFPCPPVYAEAALIPFRQHIIYDGILYPYATTFGRGFCFSLNEAYREAKEELGIIETL